MSGSLEDRATAKLAKLNSRREAHAVVDRWKVSALVEDMDQALKPDPFGPTARDLYEFKEAYAMISEMNGGSMDRDSVDYVFQALGLTLQREDLDKILEEATVDGVFTMDSVLEEFRQWKIEQIDKEDLKALFLMLAKDKYVHTTFPKNFKYKDTQNTMSKSSKSSKKTENLITEGTVLSMIEELSMAGNKTEEIGREDALGFLVEIKHKLEKQSVQLGIHYEEFERLFASSDNF